MTWYYYLISVAFAWFTGYLHGVLSCADYFKAKTRGPKSEADNSLTKEEVKP